MSFKPFFIGKTRQMSTEAFIVKGGKKLSGEIVPQGAKNEALQVLCAPLLTKEKVIIRNVPDILDVQKLISLLEGLGVEVKRLRKNSYSFHAKKINIEYFSSDEYQQKSRSIRGSVMLMGALLSRCKKAFLPKPGGDKIGRRRLDTHFHGFEKLGAKFIYDKKADKYYLEGKKLKGSDMLMDEISVTGTANMLLVAVMASGKTIIYNAACEPYVQQLSRMLVSMGANIEGIGSNRLIVKGVRKLKGTTHTVMPDMIEIGSFIGMAAMTQSKLTIKGAYKADLGIIPSVFEKLGVKLERKGTDLIIPAQKKYTIQSFIDGSIMSIYDSPWPGFTPDLISILLVMATQAEGSVLIHQKMFESRLFFVDKLIEMGAQIILCDPHRATVIGLNRKSKLKAISMTSPDIRAGVALLIAALSADGTSTIYNINQIDRGYENIEERLQALGADIQRVEV